jgi:hypothetical protein
MWESKDKLKYSRVNGNPQGQTGVHRKLKPVFITASNHDNQDHLQEKLAPFIIVLCIHLVQDLEKLKIWQKQRKCGSRFCSINK